VPTFGTARAGARRWIRSPRSRRGRARVVPGAASKVCRYGRGRQAREQQCSKQVRGLVRRDRAVNEGSGAALRVGLGVCGGAAGGTFERSITYRMPINGRAEDGRLQCLRLGERARVASARPERAQPATWRSAPSFAARRASRGRSGFIPSHRAGRVMRAWPSARRAPSFMPSRLNERRHDVLTSVVALVGQLVGGVPLSPGAPAALGCQRVARPGPEWLMCYPCVCCAPEGRTR
jgi:hypothetical protein